MFGCISSIHKVPPGRTERTPRAGFRYTGICKLRSRKMVLASRGPLRMLEGYNQQIDDLRVRELERIDVLPFIAPDLSFDQLLCTESGGFRI